MTASRSLPRPAADPVTPDLLQYALDFLPVCVRHCGCPDRWHLLWSGLGGLGLMRTLYTQTALLRDVLEPHWVMGGNVLIAGAADTGSFDVLTGLFDDPHARYTLVDPCEAPLQLVRRRAESVGRPLQIVRGRADEVAAASRWDLAFIHNTLSFMDAATRLRLLSSLAGSLSPHGVIACAIRYRESPGPEDAERVQNWIAITRASFAQRYAQHPELVQALETALPGYAISRELRERTTPNMDTVIRECEAAGLRVLENRDIPRRVMTNATDLPRPGEMRHRLLLLAAAR